MSEFYNNIPEYEQFAGDKVIENRATEIIKEFPEECKKMNPKRLIMAISSYFHDTAKSPYPHPELESIFAAEHTYAEVLRDKLKGSELSHKEVSDALKSMDKFYREDNITENFSPRIKVKSGDCGRVFYPKKSKGNAPSPVEVEGPVVENIDVDAKIHNLRNRINPDANAGDISAPKQPDNVTIPLSEIILSNKNGGNDK